MGFVRTLKNFAPPPREDGIPFTSMRLEEAPAESGPWTAIATSLTTLVPVDVDPANPQLRSLTTGDATIPDGWLRVIFIDDNSDVSVGDAVNAQTADVTNLATVADIRRVLKLRNPALVPDADIQYYLNVTASALVNKLPQYTTPAGTAVQFNVDRGGMVWLPVPNVDVTAVRAYETNTGGATLLSAGKWDYALQQHGVLLLGFKNAPSINDIRYYTPPFDVGTRWDRVEVDWVNAGEVPWAVREGVALAAAALYQTNSKLTGGMRSERIGDYSYTLSDKDVDEVMPARARKLLKPYMRRKHVFVT